jgi:hypothetical protein
VSSIAFDHIALGMPRIADAVPFLVGVLGGVPHSGARGGPQFRFGTWRYDGGGKIEADLDEACDRARARGYDIVGYDDSDDDWKTAFLHPKQALGIVVQFAQTSGGTEPSRWRPPATVEDPPPPVRVLGLRMRVSAAERARAQWEGILQGSRVEDGRRMVWRWPGSPMAITVDVDPSVGEGPMAIELGASRPLSLPDGPVPGLGATFRLERLGP